MGVNILTMGYGPCYSVTSAFGISESWVGKCQKQKNYRIQPVYGTMSYQRCFYWEANKASGSLPCKGSYQGPRRALAVCLQIICSSKIWESKIFLIQSFKTTVSFHSYLSSIRLPLMLGGDEVWGGIERPAKESWVGNTYSLGLMAILMWSTAMSLYSQVIDNCPAVLV